MYKLTDELSSDTLLEIHIKWSDVQKYINNIRDNYKAHTANNKNPIFDKILTLRKCLVGA